MTKLFATLLILFTSLNYAQENTTEKIKITFTQTSNGHIIIPAKINGIEGNFIFDTGAGTNLLTKKFAEKITDLKRTDHFYTGHRATGEALQVDLWNSEFLEIGDFKLDNELFAVYDIEFPLDGLISLTPFINKPITIDFENKVLILETVKSLEQITKKEHFEMPIQVSNDREIKITIAMTIKLEDQLILNVNLDSGAGFDVYRFSSRYMKELGINKSSLKNEYRPSMFKPVEGNEYYFTNLSSMTDIGGNTTVADFAATFIDGLIHEGIMSVNWIGKEFTIDIHNKRIIVTK